MIRDLVERNLARLKLQTDNHDEVVDIVTRAVGAAADDAVRDLLRRQGIPTPAAPERTDESPADDPDGTVVRGGRRGRSAKSAE